MDLGGICVFLFFCITETVAEVCYEYKNSNTRAFECSDGCCGSTSDAYCCMSPILIVGIVVGSLAGLLIIGVIVFICYQKYKQRQFNKVQKISIGDLNDKHSKPNKETKTQTIAKGGTVSTHHGVYNQRNGGYNNSIFEDTQAPPPPVPRTGTWLSKTNNPQGTNGLPYPPINPWIQPEGPKTTSSFNLPVVNSLPAHPDEKDLYAQSLPIRPLPGSLPPLPPLQLQPK